MIISIILDPSFGKEHNYEDDVCNEDFKKRLFNGVPEPLNAIIAKEDERIAKEIMEKKKKEAEERQTSERVTDWCERIEGKGRNNEEQLRRVAASQMPTDEDDTIPRRSRLSRILHGKTSAERIRDLKI